MRLTAALVLAVCLACTTTVHEADCTCALNTPDGRVELSQETREYKKRPVLDKLTDGVLGIFAWLGL